MTYKVSSTPGAGGANISVSQTSEFLVEDGPCAPTSAEGLAVVERLPQDDLLAVAGSNEIDNRDDIIDALQGSLRAAYARIASLEANRSLPLDEPADMINHPPHYQGKVECIDAIESALGRDGFISYCRGNAMKYTFRAGKKGDCCEDMAKAEWYLAKAREAA